jgi:YggT family protein
VGFAVVLNTIASAARVIAAAAFLFSLLVWLMHWAVRSGKVEPFNPTVRALRRLSDPLLRPVERRLVRGGANPQDAPLWLLGGAVVGGLAFIAAVGWLLDIVGELVYRAQGGGRMLGAVVLHDVFSVLMAALFVRVVASWLGIGPYSRFMRLVHALTDWLVDPLRRVIPPLGMFDISPFVAYIVLYFAERLILQSFF